MKIAAVLIALLFAFGIVHADELRIVELKSGKTISVAKLVQNLQKYDVIFFGEYHDNSTIHNLQRDVLTQIKLKPELVLSFEMFERDVQSVLDSYLAGKIDEAEFLRDSRPWGNYESDYRALVEYAKEKGLKAIAANVPRYLAGKLSRQGMAFIEELDPEERSWMAANITAPRDEYQKAFYEMMSMASSGEHGMMDSTKNLEKMYQAQCLKDDTMAESIVKAFAGNPKLKLIHFNGDFHSRSFLGTVSRVTKALPKRKIAVISPQYETNWQNYKISEADKKAATYLILLPEPSLEGE